VGSSLRLSTGCIATGWKEARQPVCKRAFSPDLWPSIGRFKSNMQKKQPYFANINQKTDCLLVIGV
jgi:hypothetical protein